LNVTYLSPGGRTGDLLKGTAILDKIGKTLAYTQVTFTNSKGQLAARGSHTKYVTGTMGEAGPYVAPEEFSDVD
jgi:acyl-coenzyme A thioesterase 13